MFLYNDVPVTYVFCPKDESIDDAEQGDHVWHVVCRLQFIYNHAEAVLLGLHTLPEDVSNNQYLLGTGHYTDRDTLT